MRILTKYQNILILRIRRGKLFNHSWHQSEVGIIKPVFSAVYYFPLNRKYRLTINLLSIVFIFHRCQLIRRQAIGWTKCDLLLNGPLGTNTPVFRQENAFGNAVRKMSAIFSRPWCFKGLHVTATLANSEKSPCIGLQSPLPGYR